MVKEIQGIVFNLTLVIIIAIVYALTIAPDITWANAGADGADLITATYMGGVPHPSGYPTYMLLAKIFQLIPLGPLAFRTNLMSAVFGVFSALLASGLVKRCIRSYIEHSWLPHWVGFITGLAFGLSQLFWAQAVITEVYTLHIFFILLVLWLTLLLGKVQFLEKAGLLAPTWLDRLGGLLFGLALGNQLTVIFLLPVWLLVDTVYFEQIRAYILSLRTSRWRRVKQSQSSLIRIINTAVNWPSFARRFGWLLLGLGVYIVIPIRARSVSPVKWGNPVDLEGLWWLVSGQAYQDRLFTLAPEFVWTRIRNWADMLQTQFGLLGLILGFYGLLYGKPRLKRFYWITVWTFLAYSIFAVGYNSSDSYVLLIPAYLAFALWIGIGTASILEYMAGQAWRNILIPITGLGLLLMIGVNAWENYPDVDASQDSRAIEFAAHVLESAPQDAMLFAYAGEDIFTLGYYMYALDHRPDLVVFMSGALVESWYREVLRETYPDLRIPDDDCYDCLKSTLIAVNPRPACEVVFDAEEIVVCHP